jgi:adenine-specific DNA-methyltransferase
MPTQKKKTVYKKIRKMKKQPASKPALQQKPKETTVELSKAKGRPMLVWVGKKPLERLTAFPAQKMEEFIPSPHRGGQGGVEWNDWPSNYPKGGLLFHGDNKEVLAHLLANGFRGKVKLIYIDPPFDSGADYVRKIELRNAKGSSMLNGESYALGEQLQYTDIWRNDSYLQFVYERLILLKELLSSDGTFWLHVDYHKGHYLKCLADEVFGESNFIDEIVWKRSAPRGNVQKGLSVAHDSILVYGMSDSVIWHPPTLSYSDEYRARFVKADHNGRQYALDNMISPNPDRPNLDYVWNGVRKVWRVTKDKMADMERQGKIEYTAQGIARYKRYLDELGGQPLTTLWDDIFPVNSQATERADYPTQKPEALLDRILNTASDPGDLVIDCFVGSGTTAAVAQKLGRRWIGCDINKGAIQTTSKRLQSILAPVSSEHYFGLIS